MGAGGAGPGFGFRAGVMPVQHAFTVDVEDWFHILDCPQSPRPDEYDSFPSRVEVNTGRVLDLLAERSVRGTFFVLGWVADRYPRLVRRIVEAGHEIGAHGYHHVLASTLSDDELEDDTRRAVAAVGAATGVAPVGYRSPGGSLLARQRWLFDLLIELGMDFDASVYPRPGGLAEAEGYPERPYVIARAARAELWEFPSTVRRWCGIRWAFAEGGYLRLLPVSVVRHWFCEREAAGLTVSCCIHPREVDPGHPRLPLNPTKQWRTRVGLKGMEAKVRALLGEFAFCPVGEVLGRTPGRP
jgi:peptidoglycan-N-acetylglucosamine deacetylase